MMNAQNTIEFEIPDGYEFDLTKSGNKTIVCTKCQGQDDSRTDAVRNVHESGETATYDPKVGDLVYAETPLKIMRFIVLRQKSGDIVIDDTFDNWSLYTGETPLIYNYIRPATAEEAALFTRILAENGYEYDPEKKEVRKNMWRAKEGEPYWFVVIRFDGIISVDRLTDHRAFISDNYYNSGNYFRTQEEAEEVAAEFRKILRNR